MSVVIEYNELVTLLENKVAVIVTGYGSASEFEKGDFEKGVKEAADALVWKYDTLYNDQWLLMYGGDEIAEGKITIANVVDYIKEKYKKTIIAIQSDFAKKWGSKLPNYVYYFDTDFDEKGDVVWSGYFADTESLAGSSKIFYGKDIIHSIKELAVFGGGPISRDETSFALKHGIPVSYTRCKAKHAEVNGEYGCVDSLFP